MTDKQRIDFILAMLSDDEITVNGTPVGSLSNAFVYTAND